MEWLDAFLAAIGIKLKALIAGAVGSFISLRFFDGLNVFEKWATFGGGALLAGYLTIPAITFMEIDNHNIEPGISLLIGLFGMSIAAAIIRVIKNTDWAALLPRGGK